MINPIRTTHKPKITQARDPPKSVGGRKSMYQIQTAVAMEQKQVRLDIIATAQQQEGLLCRSIQRSSQDLHARTSYEHARRNFIQAPKRRVFKILHTCKDLLRRISTGSPQDLLTRTCSRSCTRTSSRASHKDLHKIMQRPLAAFHKDLHKIFKQKCIKERAPKRILQPSCASPRDRNAHGMSSFTREFTGKKLRPRSATTALCETAQLKCT